jgi:hypothetical protein
VKTDDDEERRKTTTTTATTKRHKLHVRQVIKVMSLACSYANENQDGRTFSSVDNSKTKFAIYDKGNRQ